MQKIMQIGQKIRKLLDFMICPPSFFRSKITGTFLDRFFSKIHKKNSTTFHIEPFFLLKSLKHLFFKSIEPLLAPFGPFFPEFLKKGFNWHFFQRIEYFTNEIKKNQVTVKKQHFSTFKAFLKRYLPMFLEKTSPSSMWHVCLAPLTIKNVEIFRFF